MLAESSLASSLLALERQLDRTQQVAAIAAAVVDDADAAHETAQQRLHSNARAAPPGVLHALDQLMQGARRCHRELDGSLANVEAHAAALDESARGLEALHRMATSSEEGLVALETGAWMQALSVASLRQTEAQRATHDLFERARAIKAHLASRRLALQRQVAAARGGGTGRPASPGKETARQSWGRAPRRDTNPAQWSTAPREPRVR